MSTLYRDLPALPVHQWWAIGYGVFAVVGLIIDIVGLKVSLIHRKLPVEVKIYGWGAEMSATVYLLRPGQSILYIMSYS